MSVNKKRKLFGGQKTLADIGFKVNKVTDADVSDKEQGNENGIGSDEPQEKVARRFQEKWLSLYKWLTYDDIEIYNFFVWPGKKNYVFWKDLNTGRDTRNAGFGV